jgi:meiotically up-regulated gene 157 (Mug157) protein
MQKFNQAGIPYMHVETKSTTHPLQYTPHVCCWSGAIFSDILVEGQAKWVG